MSDNNTKTTLPISGQVEQAIEDGQRLISYIAKNGNTELPSELAQAMIEAKYKAASGDWGAEDETRFLINYDKLANIVYPVTVESINAIIPDQSSDSVTTTKAEKAVAWYRRYTVIALAILLIAQLYWMIGNNLRVNLKAIFDQREVNHASLIKDKSVGVELAQLKETLRLANQKLDANYQLLKKWNQISSFGMSFSGDMPEYTKERLSYKDASSYGVEKPGQTADPQLKNDKEAELDRGLYKARIMYFKNLLAADFFLDAFQGYILPLLYGLLGAFIYVLRSLLKEIKRLTYTFDSEIRYRLRLTLGALGGMVVGWFFKPQGVDSLASLSPMALAFLMGYNVDVLFSIMDRMIDNIRGSIEKTPAAQKPPVSSE
jgi:hypothetical protein